MKLGLMTAAFGELSLDEVAAWAAANGYDMLEVACWPSSGSERRRYAAARELHRLLRGPVRGRVPCRLSPAR